jgi:hypothetical protein
MYDQCLPCANLTAPSIGGWQIRLKGFTGKFSCLCRPFYMCQMMINEGLLVFIKNWLKETKMCLVCFLPLWFSNHPTLSSLSCSDHSRVRVVIKNDLLLSHFLLHHTHFTGRDYLAFFIAAFFVLMKRQRVRESFSRSQGAARCLFVANALLVKP